MMVWGSTYHGLKVTRILSDATCSLTQATPASTVEAISPTTTFETVAKQCILGVNDFEEAHNLSLMRLEGCSRSTIAACLRRNLKGTASETEIANFMQSSLSDSSSFSPSFSSSSSSESCSASARTKRAKVKKQNKKHGMEIDCRTVAIYGAQVKQLKRIKVSWLCRHCQLHRKVSNFVTDTQQICSCVPCPGEHFPIEVIAVVDDCTAEVRLGLAISFMTVLLNIIKHCHHIALLILVHSCFLHVLQF